MLCLKSEMSGNKPPSFKVSWAVAGYLVLIFLLISLGSAPASVRADELPTFDRKIPVECVLDSNNKALRIQCSQGPKGCTCLAASPFLKDADGRPTDKHMDGLTYCQDKSHTDRMKQIADQGCTLVPAQPEAPEGFLRDDSGRLFQSSFDLRNRFYLGAGWNPSGNKDSVDLSRMSFDYGFELYERAWNKRERDNYRFIEGSFSFEPFDFDVMVFQYDLNMNSEEPVFWITTFIGPPTRFDISSKLGWGLRLLKLDYHPMTSDMIEFENFAIYASWDIAHSDNLNNHMRLALGGRFGQSFWGHVKTSGKSVVDTDVWLDPFVQLSGSFMLDSEGFHYFGLSLDGTPRLNFEDMSVVDYVVKGSIHYEWVFMALNDQPISLYLEAGGQYREDLPDLPDGWEWRGLVGARFSFGPPPVYRDDP